MTKYFISYSRSDSDFVIKLAKQLREHRINLWLDQLDIRAGERWDRAIEKALKECEGMLVVLSPSSTQSENVLDEISYAIEEGKSVVPVLLKPCTIPYRLRRLQYANFTDQYNTGFTQLLNVLEADIEIPNFGKAPVIFKEGQSLPSTVKADQKLPALDSKRLNNLWRDRLISFLIPAVCWFIFEFIVISLFNQNGELTKFDDLLLVDNWGSVALILNPVLVGILAKRDKMKNLLSIAAYGFGSLLATPIIIEFRDLFSIPLIYLAPAWGAFIGLIIQSLEARKK